MTFVAPSLRIGWAALCIGVVGCGERPSVDETESDQAQRPSALDVELPWDAARPTSDIGDLPRATIILMLDTLRWDYLSCYGSVVPTPNIDRMAEESTLFERAYSTSTWTKPACASIFTGLHPTLLGVEGRLDALPETVLTLGEAWARAGKPAHGITTNGNAGEAWGFSRGFTNWRIPQQTGERLVKHRAEHVLSEFDALVKEEGIGEGALLWLHFVDPHEPFYAQEGVELGAGREFLHRIDVDGARAEEMQLVKDLYAGEVRYLDAQLGLLFDYLREIEVYEESLIILVSDHGEGLWDHGERAHGQKPHDEQIHVPLMIKAPSSWGVSPSRSSATVSIIDIFPTVLEANQLPLPSVSQGVSLSAAMRNADIPRSYSYFSIGHNGVFFDGIVGPSKKVISPTWDSGEAKACVGDGEQNMHQLAFSFFGRHAQPSSPANEMVRANKGVLPVSYVPTSPVPEGLVLQVPNLLPPATDEWYGFQDGQWLARTRGWENAGSAPEQLGSVLWAVRGFDADNRFGLNMIPLPDLGEELLEELQGLGYVDGDEGE